MGTQGLLDDENIDIAKYVLEEGLLENDIEIGVAKKVADMGYASLTEKQKNVFEKYIRPHVKQKCIMCEKYMTVDDLRFGDGVYCDHCKWVIDGD